MTLNGGEIVQGPLNAPALQGCRIESLQLNSGMAVGGGGVSGVIRVSPACQQALDQGLVRVRVTVNQPGAGAASEVNPRINMPGTYDFVVGTMQVTLPTDVTLTALLVVPLPLSSFFIVNSAATTVRLMPPLLGQIQFSETLPSAGPPVTGRVVLLRPAPPGGAEVFLESSRPPLVSVPASVTVPAGMTAAEFPVTPVTPVFGIAVPVTLTAFHMGTRHTTAFTLLPPQVTGISVEPNPVVGGNPVRVTVNFDSNVALPIPITIQVGSQSAAYSVKGASGIIAPVPTERPALPPGQQITVPVMVTIGSQQVTSPTPVTIVAPGQIAAGPPPDLIRRLRMFQPGQGG